MGRAFEQVVAFENLRQAAWEVFRGKRGREGANALFFRLESELFRLQSDLRERRYRPGPYRTFWVFEPKPRLISAAPLIDRIVHHALVRVVEPTFERRFIHHSYACRTGKGNHRALEQFVAWARTSKFALMLDIQKFFPSIDHAVLKGEIRRGSSDEGILWLFDALIDGSNPQEPVPGYFPGDDLFAAGDRRRGLPIGNLTSQFLANVLLDRVDHLVKDRLRMHRYLRYVDDLAVFHDDPGVLRAVREGIRDELLCLRLRLNEKKSRLRRVKEGLRYLGFVVTPTQLRLDQRAVLRHRRRLRALAWRYGRGDIDFARVRMVLRAAHAHAEHGTTHRFLRRSTGRTAFIRRNPARSPRVG